MCGLLFGVRSTPVLPQWHVKEPCHSAKSAGGRLHLNTHTPLTQRSRSGLTMPLSRHSVGTYPETSSHATCQGTLSHSRLSSLSRCGLIRISVRELISTSKNKIKSAGGESSHSPKSSHERKNPPTIVYSDCMKVTCKTFLQHGSVRDICLAQRGTPGTADA